MKGNLVPANSGNSEGGKAVKLSRDSGSTLFTLIGEIAVIKRLERISQRAESHLEEKFNNLLTLITLDMLHMSFSRLKSDKSPGIDGQSVGDYGANVEENLQGLLQRLHRGSYRCDPYNHEATVYNSCGDRNCPQCSGAKRGNWLDSTLQLTIP